MFRTVSTHVEANSVYTTQHGQIEDGVKLPYARGSRIFNTPIYTKPVTNSAHISSKHSKLDSDTLLSTSRIKTCNVVSSN